MKNTFYAIEIVETGTWAMWDGFNWDDNHTPSKDLTHPVICFKDDEEITNNYRVAQHWAWGATADIGTKCRVVALVVTRKGGVR